MIKKRKAHLERTNPNIKQSIELTTCRNESQTSTENQTEQRDPTRKEEAAGASKLEDEDGEEEGDSA